MDDGYIRLDECLIRKGLVASRARAKTLIEYGVWVDGRKLYKPGIRVKKSAKIKPTGTDFFWVSRAGLKLEHAVCTWSIDISQKRCLDVGASTGGFTQVLLTHGADSVYAVDVGHGQLAKKILNHPRVINLEGVDIRDISFRQIFEKVDLVTVDVSFISLTKVLPGIIKFLRSGGSMVLLVKPEFEMGRRQKTGVIRDRGKHQKVVTDVRNFARKLGLKEAGLSESPILGVKGNKEFLLYLKYQ